MSTAKIVKTDPRVAEQIRNLPEYIDAALKHDIPDNSKTLAQIAKYHETIDSDTRNQIVNQICSGYYRLVMSQARTYAKYSHRVGVQELIGVGVEGIIKAIQRYDVDKLTHEGIPSTFSGYALWWIRSAMQTEVARMGSNKPTSLRKYWDKVMPELDVTASSVAEFEVANSGDATEVLLEEGYDPLLSFDDQAQIDAVETVAKNVLTYKQLFVYSLRLRMELQDQTPMTLSQIATMMGVSTAAVGKLELKVKSKLRTHMALILGTE